MTQAEELFQHLELLGEEVEFVRYPGGSHILDYHAPSQDVDLYAALDRVARLARAGRGAREGWRAAQRAVSQARHSSPRERGRPPLTSRGIRGGRRPVMTPGQH